MAGEPETRTVLTPSDTEEAREEGEETAKEEEEERDCFCRSSWLLLLLEELALSDDRSGVDGVVSSS